MMTITDDECEAILYGRSRVGRPSPATTRPSASAKLNSSNAGFFWCVSCVAVVVLPAILAGLCRRADASKHAAKKGDDAIGAGVCVCGFSEACVPSIYAHNTHRRHSRNPVGGVRNIRLRNDRINIECSWEN